MDECKLKIMKYWKNVQVVVILPSVKSREGPYLSTFSFLFSFSTNNQIRMFHMKLYQNQMTNGRF